MPLVNSYFFNHFLNVYFNRIFTLLFSIKKRQLNVQSRLLLHCDALLHIYFYSYSSNNSIGMRQTLRI